MLELRFVPGAVEAQIFFKGFEGDYVEVSSAEPGRRVKSTDSHGDPQGRRHRPRQGGVSQDCEPRCADARPCRPVR